MYKIIFNLLFMLTSLGCLAQTPANQPIDVTHVEIDLRFDWTARQAFGKTTMSLTTLQTIESILVDAVELDIHEISMNGKPLKFKALESKKGIKIFLNKKYPAHEKLTVTIDYHTRYVNEYDPNWIGGSFGKGLRFFQPTKVNPGKRKQIWSQGEPDGNPYWFPCINTLNDLRTTEFKATVDDGLMAVSNGELANRYSNRDGTTTFHYKTEIPYPNYLTAFVVGAYTDLVQKHNDATLHTFCYTDEQAAATATTARFSDMAEFLSVKTGTSLPFKNYAQVMVQNYPFPSLTGQNTFSIISDNMIDDYGTHADFLYLWDGVEFNALASQWFGNLITPQTWNDLWLTKAFAQYFEGLYTDYKNGHEEYLLWYHPFESGSVFGDWNNGNRHAIVPRSIDNLENFTNDSYTKFRGALVLRMLRKELGDQHFFNSIKHFLANYKFKPVTTADFQKSIRVVSGKDMQWFFDQWIYNTGHPLFEINKQYDQQKKQLLLTVKQLQPADTITNRNQYFQGNVTVEIDHKLEDIRLEAKAENHFSIPCPQQPKLVQFDVDNTWIKEVTVERSFEEVLYQFQHDRDISGRQAAMMELVYIANDTSSTPEMKEKINRAFYDVVGSNLYWRMRMNAISQWRAILPLPYDKKTTDLLLTLIKEERSWLRASAISMLGMTNDQQYDDLYISLLADTSDRVINVAAIALGKTKSPKAFDALVKLKSRPSWKNQSLMSALNGLAQLKDPRGIEIAVAALADVQLPRWYLGNGWDYPFVAAQALASLGAGDKAYPLVLDRFKIALQENNLDDIFDHVLLITTLADPKGKEVFELLKQKYKGNETIMTAITNYEEQFNSSIK